jgi:hypothetical protein
MAGIPTQFAVADLVLDALRRNGEPVPADAELPFFYLGAIGPALGDFLPAHFDTASATTNAPLLAVWLPILQLLAGTGGAPPTSGMAQNLKTLTGTLRPFQTAVRDEDKFALLAMKSDLQALTSLIPVIQAQFGTVDTLRTGLPKAVMGVKPTDKVPPASSWHGRDVVHGYLTGRFWGGLRRRASDSADPRLRAFGLGATVGYAGALSVNPFINGVVGAPHRDHWWRHRWVSHYVDAWVWGYYRTRERVRANGKEIVFYKDRVPVPPYAAWDNIPGAKLQDRLAIGGITADAVLNTIRDATPTPPFLPDELVTLWLDAYREVIGNPLPAGVDPAGLQGAYALTWLTTWISSSDAFGATAPDRINEPDDCGPRPDWVAPDGSVVVGGTLVPPPTISQPSPSVAEIASAIVAAILAAASFLLGAIAAGIVLIVASVELIDDATDPDWTKLRCHAGWVQAFLARLENAMRDLLSAAGLAPPFAVQLAHNEIQFATWNGRIVPPFAALNTCRSPSASEEDYPASVWQSTPTTSDWTLYPSEPLETPGQVSYSEGSWWPRHAVDGFSFVDRGPTVVPRYPSSQDNPLATAAGRPSVLDAGEWERRMTRAEQGARPRVASATPST